MFVKLLSLTTALASLAFREVSAHGYVQDVVIGSTHYTGYLPYTDPYYNPPPERIIRKIPGNGPVTDLSLIEYVFVRYYPSGCFVNRVSL